tara:strand:- start:245 stop:475 length:231 start_codon:yes stop_codon:yes gene_type:complete
LPVAIKAESPEIRKLKEEISNNYKCYVRLPGYPSRMDDHFANENYIHLKTLHQILAAKIPDMGRSERKLLSGFMPS